MTSKPNEYPLMADTRSYLQQIGLPQGDLNDLPDSPHRFPDGKSFRIEIPTINSVGACMAALEESNKLGIQINRITETLGIFRHLKREITEWLKGCNDYGCELLMSPGPRATYDTSATALTAQGSRIGYRLRGQEQLVRAITDVRRAIDLGVNGFLIYDEGMLSVLSRMRHDGKMPKDTHFKVSAHCGHANAASCQMLWNLGADSINPVRDLQLPMIASIRAAVPIPLDIHTDNPPSSGGFIRAYEASEIVRIAAPVHLKTGNSVLSGHGEATTADDARRMVRQAALTIEMIEELAPTLQQSKSRVLSPVPV
jgi:hypothetical protein